VAEPDVTVVAASELQTGFRYLTGDGVEKSPAEAAKWFRKAAERNYAPAQYKLGLCYQEGEGLEKDDTEAAKWFRKAAEQNDAKAQFYLASCYLTGQGVPTDYAEAVKWFRKAAEQNFAPAQGMLGLHYHAGVGGLKNYPEAVKWWRKAAEQNDFQSQYNLGDCYMSGEGVRRDPAEAVKWYRKAALQNYAPARRVLATCYYSGLGVSKNYPEAVKWSRKAAEQGDGRAQALLGFCYYFGQGVAKNYPEAVKWLRKAAEQNLPQAQSQLARCYSLGEGVPKDYVEAYKWLLLAAAQGDDRSTKAVSLLETLMSREQVARGQELARDFKPREGRAVGAEISGAAKTQTRPSSAGTGFFITEDGYVITNAHVLGNSAQVRLLTASGLLSARVLKVDSANDLALLKAEGKLPRVEDILDSKPDVARTPEGKFEALPVATSRSVKLGNTVVTLGFPNIGLQGFAPKFARGEIASLAGAMDDPRFFQISVPLQPGNSGGALVDERGNVIGVVSAKLSASAALKTSGALPENVNYAVKSSFLLGFLESVPEVASKLKEPNTSAIPTAEVVEKAKAAAVLVLVY
jgi:TPR repeat protein